MFRLDQKLIPNGSYLIDYITLAPNALVRTFGHGMNGDKTSGEYYFIDDDGAIFTLYDWCSEYGAPSGFWESDYPEEFHIGGLNVTDMKLQQFKDWLLKTINPEE